MMPVAFASRPLLMSAVAAASLQIASALAQEEQGNQLEEIVVTGSRIQSGIDSDLNALPVQVLTLEQFEYTPADSVADFLHELPSIGNSDSIYQDEGGGGNSSVNLRGAGVGYTLSLVNGRRFGGEDAPDVGALPPEAIGGIEILKTGSSAIYGSDAVAGVVNIKLRDNFEGLQITGTYGEATRDYDPPSSIADYEDVNVGRALSGDGSNSRVGALFGTSGERWRFTGSLSYQDFEGFSRADRDVTATRDFRRFGGADRRGVRGAPHSLINLLNGELVSIDIDRFSPGYVPTSSDDFVTYNEELQKLSGAEQGTAPPMERYSGHWSASFDINAATRLYTFGYADYREQEFNYHEPRVEVNVLNPSNPNNVLNAPVIAFVSLDPSVHGFNSRDIDTSNWQATIGVEGTIGDRWNYDVSYTVYEKIVDTVGKNGVSTSAAQALADSGEFNPFCYRCTSADVFAQMTANPEIETTSDVETFDVLFSGDLFEYGPGTVSGAVGYQFRGIKGAFRPDQVAQTFDEWFVGVSGDPISDSRNVNAFFAELLVPLYSGSSDDFVTAAEISGAVRREDYSDFGAETVSQVLGRIAFIDEQVIFRVGYAESFRAPPVSQLVLPVVTNTNNSGFFFDPVRGGFFDLDITSGGNPDLDSGDGLSQNIGLIVRPDAVPGLYLSADFWTLEIDNIIRAPGTQEVLLGLDPAGTVTRDPETLYPTVDVTFVNSGTREIEGWDFGASYAMETRFGNFDFYGNATYFTKFEDSFAGVTQEYLGEYINGEANPRFRFAGGINWNRNAWDAGFSFHYYSSYWDRFEPLDINQKTDEQYTADLQVGYDFGYATREGALSGLRVFAGVENMFDQDPPWLAESANGWDRFFGDLRGRYVYGGARITFLQ
ncbi:MAG: TonB-dependent receptor plug domain-containing protein [Pseudomonadota bacterium]